VSLQNFVAFINLLILKIEHFDEQILSDKGDNDTSIRWNLNQSDLAIFILLFQL